MKNFTPKFKAFNRKGKLEFFNPEAFEVYLRSQPEEVQVGITSKANLRSPHQNRYYWGCVLPLISETTGYIPTECHDILRALFLRESKAVDTKSGEIEIDCCRSTADLSTIAFEEYLSQVRQWASIELACYIPMPNEIEF